MAFEARAEVFDDICPHPDGVDPDDELIHERAYVVRSYFKSTDRLLIRGAVRDQKPPGLYVPEDQQGRGKVICEIAGSSARHRLEVGR